MFMFGYPIENSVAYWGARAIYRSYQNDYAIDLLPDRMQMDSGTEQQKKDLSNWIFLRGLPRLQELLRERGVLTSDPQVIEIVEFKYILRASPNASYGYLYIGAAEMPVVSAGVHRNESANKDELVYETNGVKFVWDAGDIPAPGTCGNVTINSIGRGVVIGYQDEKYGEHRLLNLRVKLAKPPMWWKLQNYRDYVRKHEATHQVEKPMGKMAWLKTASCVVWGESFKVNS